MRSKLSCNSWYTAASWRVVRSSASFCRRRTVSQHAGQDSGQAERGDFQQLVFGVGVQQAPGRDDVRQVRGAGQRRRGDSPTPSENQARINHRQVVQVLIDVMPVHAGERGQVVQQADRQDAAAHGRRLGPPDFPFRADEIRAPQDPMLADSGRPEIGRAVSHFGKFGLSW